MNFIEAVNLMKENSEIKVRRAFWKNDESEDPKRFRVKYNAQNNTLEAGVEGMMWNPNYIPTLGAYVADDWEIYTETYTFSAALEMMKQGKKMQLQGEGTYIFIKKNKLYTVYDNQSNIIVESEIFRLQDMLRNDWIEYKEDNHEA